MMSIYRVILDDDPNTTAYFTSTKKVAMFLSAQDPSVKFKPMYVQLSDKFRGKFQWQHELTQTNRRALISRYPVDEGFK